MPGFLVNKHSCSASWYFAIESSEEFRNSELFHVEQDISLMANELRSCSQVDKKEVLLRNQYHESYIAMLINTGNAKIMDVLECEINPKNFTFHLFSKEAVELG